MSLRTVLDPFGSDAVLVDKLIGNSYKIVRYVACHIEYIKHVSANMAEVYRVAQSIEAVDTLNEKMAILEAIFADLAKVVLVGENINAVNSAYENMTEIVAIFANLEAINHVHENLDDIITSLDGAVSVINARIATIPEAIAGISNNKLITPEGVQAYVDNRLADDTIPDTDSEKLSTPEDVVRRVINRAKDGLVMLPVVGETTLGAGLADVSTTASTALETANSVSSMAVVLSNRIDTIDVDFDILDSKIDALELNADSITKATWIALNAITGTRSGQRGYVPTSDAGTHTDPVVGGTVPNSGTYSWSVSPAGWQRVDAYQDVTSVDARTAGLTPTSVTFLGRTSVIESDDVIIQGKAVKIGGPYGPVLDVNGASGILTAVADMAFDEGAQFRKKATVPDHAVATAPQSLVLPDSPNAFVLFDRLGNEALRIDTRNRVISTDYEFFGKIGGDPYEDPRKYPVDYTPVAPSLILDTSNTAYTERKFQGIPSVARTGNRLWTAWTGDISGVERVGNFLVLNYSDDEWATSTEVGYIAYDGDLTKAVSIAGLWGAPNGELWIYFTVVGDNSWFDGQMGSYCIVITNPEAATKDLLNFQKPFRLTHTGAPNQTVPVRGQHWMSVDHWYNQGPRKALYGDRVGKRIHRVHWGDRRLEYLFTLPETVLNRTYDETQFVECADGSLLAVWRTTLTPMAYLSSRSTDLGKTWTGPAAMAGISAAPASRCWLGVSPSGRLVLVYNNATTRTNLTVKLSEDNGASWSYSTVITPALASYPWCTFGPGGKLHIVYDNGRETAGLRRIDGVTLREDDIIAGTATADVRIISYKGDVA